MNFLDGIPFINDIPLDIRVNIVRVLLVILIFLVFWLLRRVIAGLLVAPIRGLVDRTQFEVDDLLFAALERVISYVVLALGIIVAVILLDFSPGAEDVFLAVAMTLIAYALLRAFYDVGTDILRTQDRARQILGLDIRPQIMPVARIALLALVIVIGLLAVAQIWALNLAGLIAGIGLGGLALSLAAKEVLDDLLGFVVIISDDVYRINEYIASPNAEGIIENIGLRSTRVRQLNQGLTIVPNATIANDPVTNWSRLERRWFNFMLGVTYSATAEQIEALTQRLRDMLKGREAINSESVVVLFTEYDDSSLNLLIRCYVNIEDWVEAHAERHAVNLEIMRIVDELDMSMAFPSRSIYLEQIPMSVRNGWSEDGGEEPLSIGQNVRPQDKNKYPGGEDEHPDTDYEGDEGE